VGAAVVVALAFRIAVVASWHAPAGDGVQYWKLANELRRAGRFAFGPSEALSYARLPGYPLFTAALFPKPIDLAQHVVVFAAVNLPLDALTALFVFLLLAELGVPVAARWAGALLTFLYPSLVLLGCYALTEPLITCLLTGELWLIVRAMRDPRPTSAAAGGLLAGAAQLVRADALTVLPALAPALLLSPLPRRQRLLAAAAFTAAALLVFAPWPIRNLARFGAPHPAAVAMRTMTGKPLPSGPIEWARTWASSQPGEAFWDFMMSNGRPFDLHRGKNLMPSMFDSPEELAELEAVVGRYNAEGLTPSVDQAFRELAARRRAVHPFKFWVVLPFKRVVNLWSPAPPWELPFRVSFLNEKAFHVALTCADKLMFALALVGAVGLWRSQRRLAAVLLAPVVARTLLYTFAIPQGTTGRYLVEAVPLLIALAVYGAISLVRLRASRAAADEPPMLRVSA
jgi:hypothetical protein